MDRFYIKPDLNADLVKDFIAKNGVTKCPTGHRFTFVQFNQGLTARMTSASVANAGRAQITHKARFGGK